MLQFSKFKITLILAVLLAGLYTALPNVFSAAHIDKLPAWLPARTVSLGLDLQGGSHLLYEVDTKELINAKLKQLSQDVRNSLTKYGYTNVQVQNDRVTLKLRDLTDLEGARAALKKAVTGVQTELKDDGTVTAYFTDTDIAEMKKRAVDQSIEIINKRIDETGTKEPTVVRQGEDRIVVQVPGYGDPQHLKDLIGKTAKMEFRMVDEAAESTGTRSAGSVQLPVVEKDGGPSQKLWIKEQVMVSGENLVDAQQGFESGMPIVQFKFDNLGARKFGDATKANVGKRFAIVLDKEVISAPVIRDAILGGSGIISGNFTTASARDLSILLRAGALPAPLTVLEERTVGADLGADSIEAGKRACLIAIAFIAVAMVVLYGLFGIFANLAMVLNGVLMLGFLSAIGATLTFPGIAGMVLTLGMAVDANVLILERVREEMRNGRSPVNAMEAGYREAQATIFDANVTHAISTMFLFAFGSGPIKGFAITLLIGIVSSVFTAVVVTRLMTSIWLRRARPKALPL
jgi:protein-export membrane protein SecD